MLMFRINTYIKQILCKSNTILLRKCEKYVKKLLIPPYSLECVYFFVPLQCINKEIFRVEKITVHITLPNYRVVCLRNS